MVTVKVARSARRVPLALRERAEVRETPMAMSALHGLGWRWSQWTLAYQSTGGETNVNRSRATLLGLGLGLALQTAPATAWWQWYSHNIPYGPAPGMWFYQAFPGYPGVPGLWPGQLWLQEHLLSLANQGGPHFWQYQTPPFGTTTLWSATVPMSGLFVEQSQTPAGYQIRVHTGQSGPPMVDISTQGGFLTMRSHSAGGVGDGGMQMQQAGWASQSIALPADANVAAMQMQRGDGVVQIFIPRGL